MGSKNTSDNIEAYIKEILAQAGIVELKRSELSDQLCYQDSIYRKSRLYRGKQAWWRWVYPYW